MIIKQIKLSNAAKDKLSRLKGKPGIQNLSSQAKIYATGFVNWK